MASSRLRAACALLAIGLAPAAQADEQVQFPSLDHKLTLTALLDRPAQAAPSPAIVMLHGCSGLSGAKGPFALYRDWRDFFADKGYVTLMVDSAGSRGFGQTCTRDLKDETARMWAERPSDAYAALAYLQSQPFVAADKIALIGWSQGGGIVLETIPAQSLGRPSPPPAHDFAGAIAFYPGLCSDKQQVIHLKTAPKSWTTSIPLLVLQGQADNWTRPKPCAAFLQDAEARNAPVTFQLYSGAYHAFDAPHTPVHAVEHYRRDSWAPVEGTNEPARADARTRVAQFLADRFGAKVAP